MAMLVREILLIMLEGLLIIVHQRFLDNYLVIDFDENIYPSDEARGCYQGLIT